MGMVCISPVRMGGCPWGAGAALLACGGASDLRCFHERFAAAGAARSLGVLHGRSAAAGAVFSLGLAVGDFPVP